MLWKENFDVDNTEELRICIGLETLDKARAKFQDEMLEVCDHSTTGLFSTLRCWEPLQTSWTLQVENIK